MSRTIRAKSHGTRGLYRHVSLAGNTPNGRGMPGPPRGRTPLITEVWDTRLPATPSFLERWNALASRAPQFNFSMDARYLAHEAASGRHSIAAIASGGEFLLVLRREGSLFAC